MRIFTQFSEQLGEHIVVFDIAYPKSQVCSCEKYFLLIALQDVELCNFTIFAV